MTYGENNIKNNCFILCIEEIAKKYKYDFEMVYAATWHFGYGIGITMADKLEAGFEDFETRIIMILSLCHGIYLKKVDDITCFLQTFTKLPKEGVIMLLDTFDCEWLPSYKTFHGKHYVLLFDKSSSDYVIKDMYINGKRQILMRSDTKLPQPFASWSNSL